MSARAKLPDPLDKLLRSELETAIKEASRRYIIEKWPQIDIAAELGWRRATVGDHIKNILPRVSDVATKLYTIRT